MTDFQSERDLLMHIAHHQYYWEERNENESQRTLWTRKQYINHITAFLTDADHVGRFLASFSTERAAPAQSRREGPTPNVRPLGPPQSEEDRRVAGPRKQISERFREEMKTEVSGKEERQPKRKHQTKRMIRTTTVHIKAVHTSIPT